VLRVAVRLGLVLASLLLALVAVEAMLRAMDLQPPPPVANEGSVYRRSEVQGLRRELIPGSRETWTYLVAGGATRVATAVINEHGFRGPALAVEKPAGRFRVACLGDSYTYGHGVDNDETWPSQLERCLRDRGRLDVDVLNWGVGGYCTVQEAVQLEARVLDFDPDLVLLGFFLNDVDREIGTDETLPGPLLFWLRPHKRGPIARLRRNWLTADLLMDRAYRTLATRAQIERQTELIDERNPGWSRTRASLLSMRDMLAARDVDFAVVLYPLLVRSGGALASHQGYSVVREFLIKSSIPHLDLEPVFAPLDVGRLRNHLFDSHPNGEAHGIAAREIADFLDAEGLLSVP
jgi:hypothetical protein